MSKLITLTLPEPVYRALLARASRRNRTVADEVLAILTRELPPVGQLPEDQEENREEFF
jgi:plasmid stability protein